MYMVIREGESLTGHRIGTDVLVYAHEDTPKLRQWIAAAVMTKLNGPHFKVLIKCEPTPPFVGTEYDPVVESLKWMMNDRGKLNRRKEPE